MTLDEHLLTCLAEECAEVIQRITKALRFGLDEVQSGQEFTNRQRLDQELVDMAAVLALCNRRKLIPDAHITHMDIARKETRIVEHMKCNEAGVDGEGFAYDSKTGVIHNPETEYRLRVSRAE